MTYDCKYSEDCEKPVFKCSEHCPEYVPYRHKCANPETCKHCEDEGYGDFLYQRME